VIKMDIRRPGGLFGDKIGSELCLVVAFLVSDVELFDIISRYLG
jgi:hypothetical protein